MHAGEFAYQVTFGCTSQLGVTAGKVTEEIVVLINNKKCLSVPVNFIFLLNFGKEKLYKWTVVDTFFHSSLGVSFCICFVVYHLYVVHYALNSVSVAHKARTEV
jgi:hypothetical protein